MKARQMVGEQRRRGWRKVKRRAITPILAAFAVMLIPIRQASTRRFLRRLTAYAYRVLEGWLFGSRYLPFAFDVGVRVRSAKGRAVLLEGVSEVNAKREVEGREEKDGRREKGSKRSERIDVNVQIDRRGIRKGVTSPHAAYQTLLLFPYYAELATVEEGSNLWNIVRREYKKSWITYLLQDESSDGKAAKASDSYCLEEARYHCKITLRKAKFRGAGVTPSLQAGRRSQLASEKLELGCQYLSEPAGGYFRKALSNCRNIAKQRLERREKLYTFYVNKTECEDILQVTFEEKLWQMLSYFLPRDRRQREGGGVRWGMVTAGVGRGSSIR
ncbi:hypothetical protein BDQ17DRAFT_1337401 [Cyathus striatus]|nr:hypothetical protein BDQ17DRAFT_1337401 [Cyathus striatus]